MLGDIAIHLVDDGSRVRGLKLETVFIKIMSIINLLSCISPDGYTRGLMLYINPIEHNSFISVSC